MPVFNEAASIHQVLTAVLEQNYPHDLIEVIVADGMSDDGTREIVSQMALQDERVKLVDNPNRITPDGLNLGIRSASGEILMRVDGHGVVPRNYLRECVEALESQSNLKAESRKLKHESAHRNTETPKYRNTETLVSDLPLIAVGGAWDCVGRGVIGQAIAFATASTFGVGNAAYRTTTSTAEAVLTDTVPFWVLHRRAFERIGLFRGEMLCHEDYEFNHRLREAGGKILLLPWLRSVYYVRPTIRALCRQYWRYGFWKGRFLCSHPQSLRLRHFVPPLFVLVLAMTAVWSLFSPLGLRCVQTLSGLYGAFLLVATLIIATSRQRSGALSPNASPQDPHKTESQSDAAAPREAESVSLSTALLIPFILAVIHLSWGIGVWLGLLRGAVPGQPPRLAA